MDEVNNEATHAEMLSLLALLLHEVKVAASSGGASHTVSCVQCGGPMQTFIPPELNAKLLNMAARVNVPEYMRGFRCMACLAPDERAMLNSKNVSLTDMLAMARIRTTTGVLDE